MATAPRTRAVADRLRQFFATWKAQLAEGTAEIWAKVERRLLHKPPHNKSTNPSAHSPQQPQQKIEDNK